MKINRMPRGRESQSGFTLFEMVLVAGLVAGVTVLGFHQKTYELEVQKAKEVGLLLQQYNEGAQKWSHDNPGATGLSYNGTSWLKPTSCSGGSELAYLPCDFPELSKENPWSYGGIYVDSNVETTGDLPSHETKVTTRTSSFDRGDGRNRADLSAIAAIAASTASTTGSIKSDIETASLSMVAGTVASTDPWLRTDGVNKMDGNITFNESLPTSLRGIRNLSRVEAMVGEALLLGPLGGGLLGERVIVDADQETYGRLVIANTRSSENAIEVERGSIKLLAGGIDASGDIKSGGNVESGNKLVSVGNVESGADISSEGAISAGTEISASVFYDKDNRSYKVDPSATSNLYRSDLAILNVSAQSNLRGDTALDGNLLLLRSVASGARCTTGSIGRNSSGKIMACENGIWAEALAGSSPSQPEYKRCRVRDYYSTSLVSIDHGKTKRVSSNSSCDIWYFCYDGNPVESKVQCGN